VIGVIAIVIAALVATATALAVIAPAGPTDGAVLTAAGGPKALVAVTVPSAVSAPVRRVAIVPIAVTVLPVATAAPAASSARVGVLVPSA